MGHVIRGPVFEPGTWHIYSDIAVNVLGEVINLAGGERVPDLIRKRVFEPLALKRIGWDFDDELAKDIVSMINEDWMGERHGSKEARQEGSVAGGLISSARDLAAFENDLKQHQVKVLLYNKQVSEKLTERLLDIAKAAKVPVVGVTETQPGNLSFQDWMLGELDAVDKALTGPSS